MTINDIWIRIWEEWTYNEYKDYFTVKINNYDLEVLKLLGQLLYESQTETRDLNETHHTCNITLTVNEIGEGDEYPDFELGISVDVEY
jgi:hypothetical protein